MTTKHAMLALRGRRMPQINASASVRMDIRKIAAIKAGQDVVGSRTRVKVVKNKVAPPFKEAEFDITYGQGISRVGDIVDLGSESGVIDKSGAWFSYNGERVGQGRENAKQYLLDHPETCAAIEAKILEHYGLTARTPKND
jgi:recombination protein RecA